DGGATTPEEPVVITTSGTIIKRYDLWQRALAQGRPDLLCLEHDVSDDVALEMIIRDQQEQGRLNAFCRVELALRLERAFRRRLSRPGSGQSNLSNLTKGQATDVRRELATLAAVS